MSWQVWISKKRLYICHLDYAVETDNVDDAHVTHHKVCEFSSYLLYMVSTSVFVNKSSYYVNFVYMKYSINFERIHEYNRRALVWFTCTQS